MPDELFHGEYILSFLFNIKVADDRNRRFFGILLKHIQIWPNLPLFILSSDFGSFKTWMTNCYHTRALGLLLYTSLTVLYFKHYNIDPVYSLDEPNFKSTFSVTLVRPSERYIALSNMPVERETENTPSIGFTEVKVTIYQWCQRMIKSHILITSQVVNDVTSR